METKQQTSVTSIYSRIGDFDVQNYTNNQPVSIYLYDVDMYTLNGYGQYVYKVELKINGEKHTYRKHTTDSQAWDNYTELKRHCEFTTSDAPLSIFMTVMDYCSTEFLEDVEQVLDQDRLQYEKELDRNED